MLWQLNGVVGREFVRHCLRCGQGEIPDNRAISAHKKAARAQAFLAALTRVPLQVIIKVSVPTVERFDFSLVCFVQILERRDRRVRIVGCIQVLSTFGLRGGTWRLGRAGFEG